MASDRQGIGDVEVDALADRRRPAVTGRDPHASHALVARQAPGERVLARTGADDEDLHAALGYGSQLGQAHRELGQLVDALLVGPEVAVGQRGLRLVVQALRLLDEALEVGRQLAG